MPALRHHCSCSPSISQRISAYKRDHITLTRAISGGLRRCVDSHCTSIVGVSFEENSVFTIWTREYYVFYIHTTTFHYYTKWPITNTCYSYTCTWKNTCMWCVRVRELSYNRKASEQISTWKGKTKSKTTNKKKTINVCIREPKYAHVVKQRNDHNSCFCPQSVGGTPMPH